MQKYRPKTPVAEFSDRLLRAGTAAMIGIGWFVILWGVCIPALTAGIALGGLLWLCVRQFSKQATRKREEQMRRIIGGELALNRLLLEPPRKAAFECALWLTPRYPLIMQKAMDWNVIGLLDGKKTCIGLVAVHPSARITAQQMVEYARGAKVRQMEQIILCLTAPAEPEAIAYASSLDPPFKIVDREELILLAGYAHPATDDDLRSIGRQKRTRHSAQEWLAVVLDESRSPRYLGYGTGLCLLALFTGGGYYPIPGLICLVLFAATKLRSLRLNRHRRWTG